MMNKQKGEQGYALLVVVLVVALIMVLFTSFMTMSINTAEQEQYVDENNLVVAAAEMGVEYYVAGLTNDYNELVHEMLDYKSLIPEIEELSDTEILTIVKEEFKREFNNRIDDYKINEETNSSKITTDYKFELREMSLCIVGNDLIQVCGEVEGKSINDNTINSTLQLDVEFPLFNQDFNEYISSNDPSNEEIRIVEKPEPKCTDSSVINNECHINEFNTKDNTQIKKATLYVENNFPTPGNQGHPPTIENSLIYIGENFNVANNFSPSNSNIYIGGDFNIGPGGTITIKNNTTICVKGDIKYNKKIMQHKIGIDGAKIFVLKKSTNAENKKYSDSGVQLVETEEQLILNCGFTPKNSDFDNDWIVPNKVDVEYYKN